MFALVVTRRMIRWGVLVVGLMLLWAWGPGLWQLGYRYVCGVRPGVTLEGRPIGGLLEHELYREVAMIAEEYVTVPQDAYYDEATGELHGEVVGTWVDVAATVANILAAAPGSGFSWSSWMSSRPSDAACSNLSTAVIPSAPTSAWPSTWTGGKRSCRRCSMCSTNTKWQQPFS